MLAGCQALLRLCFLHHLSQAAPCYPEKQTNPSGLAVDQTTVARHRVTGGRLSSTGHHKSSQTETMARTLKSMSTELPSLFCEKWCKTDGEFYLETLLCSAMNKLPSGYSLPEVRMRMQRHLTTDCCQGCSASSSPSL